MINRNKSYCIISNCGLISIHLLGLFIKETLHQDVPPQHATNDKDRVNKQEVMPSIPQTRCTVRTPSIPAGILSNIILNLDELVALTFVYRMVGVWYVINGCQENRKVITQWWRKSTVQVARYLALVKKPRK